MAIDTAAKRQSLMGLDTEWVPLMPAADGSFDSADRQMFLLLYAGSTLSAPAVGAASRIFTLRASPRTLTAYASASTFTLRPAPATLTAESET